MHPRISSKFTLSLPSTIKSNNRQQHRNIQIDAHFDKKIGLNKPGMVWHSSKLNPDHIYAQKGLVAHGTNPTLELHIINKACIYVPFGKSMLDSIRFCKPLHYDKNAKFNVGLGSYLYLTNKPEIHVDVQTSYMGKVLAREGIGQTSFAESENEISGIGNMPFADIYAGRRYFAVPGIGLPYVFSGSLYYNSEHQPRNWSITIPSASANEAKEFEGELRHVGYIKDNERFITLDEAKEMTLALKDQAQNYRLSIDSNPISFQKIPASLTSQQAVSHVAKEYDAFNRKQGIEPHTKVVSMSGSSSKEQAPKKETPWTAAITIAEKQQTAIDVSGRCSLSSSALFGKKPIAAKADETPKETDKNESTHIKKP